MSEPKDSAERLTNMEATMVRASSPVTRLVADPVLPVSVTQTAPTFEAFYAECYNDLVRALSLTLGDPTFGREAADEAMTRAFGKWDAVGDYANPAGWAYRVGLNWARSWHRKLSRKLPWHEIDEGMPSAKDVELERALEELELKYRSVVVCRYLLDWSTEETATALQIAPGTVKSRLSTGLIKLRSVLHEPESDGATPSRNDADEGRKNPTS